MHETLKEGERRLDHRSKKIKVWQLSAQSLLGYLGVCVDVYNQRSRPRLYIRSLVDFPRFGRLIVEVMKSESAHAVSFPKPKEVFLQPEQLVTLSRAVCRSDPWRLQLFSIVP